jgi:hypothetical protein
MVREVIIALILTIAAEKGVPPNFALAIAISESDLINICSSEVRPPNADGSVDRGIFQLNSFIYPDIEWWCIETNIRIGVRHLRTLIERNDHNTYWQVAVSYNAGHAWVVRRERPPESSLNFADRVMGNWQNLERGGYICPVISRYKQWR